jgi:hypothetical protein
MFWSSDKNPAILTEIIKDIALSKAFEQRELIDRETIEDPLLNVIGILSGEPISTDNIDQVKFNPTLLDTKYLKSYLTPEYNNYLNQ